MRRTLKRYKDKETVKTKEVIEKVSKMAEELDVSPTSLQQKS
jgi:translation elongation factor EF-G